MQAQIHNVGTTEATTKSFSDGDVEPYIAMVASDTGYWFSVHKGGPL